ncbi:MAG: glycosyltransferase family 39 protein [Thermodesulfovibrionia bacterium]|nr:glycosyltransferase family 39 protein [Thermodesulfovibrionia bacterium]
MTDKSYPINQGLFQKPVSQISLIVILFISAFSIRLYNITNPPLDFVPVRQYQQAHIARGYFFENQDLISESRKDIARMNIQRMGLMLEPRIIENITVLGYEIIGKESLAIPRVLSSVFWIIGGIFLYLTAKQAVHRSAAIFSAAFYLFLPFGISASRSFLPDSMMIMMLIISLFTILRYYDQPSRLSLLFSAVISALAIFIKPFSLFIILCVFLALSIFRKGLRRSVFDPNLFIFTLLSLLPTASYYIYGILSNTGFLKEQAQASFLPHLLLEPYFWGGWLEMIGQVTGYIPFMVALICFFLVRDGQLKALLSGLWAGFFVFGLFFTYHIHTHAYYQLQLIPVVALSLGPVFTAGFDRYSDLFASRKRMIGIVTILLVVLVGTGLNIRQARFNDYKDYVKVFASYIGVNPGFHNILKDYEREVRNAKKIGEIVGHSTNTLLLTADFGRSLAYYGELSGLPWPTAFSLQARKKRGLRIPAKEELFSSKYLTVRTHGKYMKYTPDFFIITSFEEFEIQKELVDFLNKEFPVFAQSDDYLIYDLRKMSAYGK